MSDQQTDSAKRSVSLEKFSEFAKIFLPNVANYAAEYKNKNIKFAHYTSAESALKIIRTKRIWMRGANCMSDYREVQHGLDLLRPHLSIVDQSPFCAALDAVCPNVIGDTISKFTDVWGQLRRPYIACLSKHDDGENEHGRLSMWRGFGGVGARVAVIFNVAPFPEKASPLPTAFIPVEYWTSNQFQAQMNVVLRNIKQADVYLKSLTPTELNAAIMYMLLHSVFSLKHEGFREEQEWRLIYIPDLNSSPLLETSVETINGIPQIIYKFPLDKQVSPDVAHLDFATIFDRIIIGPTPFGEAMREAFAVELGKVGVVNPADRIVVSGIPIRS